MDSQITTQHGAQSGARLARPLGSPSNDSTSKPKEEIYELALFAGAGGGILGGKLLGWRTVCAVEINEYARRVLVARQDDGCLQPFPIWDDVTTFDGKPWRGLVDVISGGFPCQDISSAGNGKGLDGERSGLWRDMARIVREVRPRYVLVENSPLLVGRGLATVLCDLAGMGYDAIWGVLGAHHAGAPHRRERAWLVAHAPLHGSGNETTSTNPGTAGWNALARLGLVRGAVGRGTDSQSGMAWNGSTWRDNGGRDAKPAILGVADGMANRVDRCHAIGNGQVPAVVRMAWHTLGVTEMENSDYPH